MERFVGRLLLVAVLAAFASLTAGIGFWLAGAHPAAWLLNAGLLILMATPFVRILFSALEFATARDWFFAGAAAIVMAILLTSAFYSRSA